MARRVRTVPRRSPRQRRSADTVAVLLEATERVLARDGYQATTTNHIAEVAGVSIGTLYHFFPSKEALIQSLVHRMWAEELSAFELRAKTVFELPLAESIRELVGVFVSEVRRRMAMYRRWYGEAPHLGQLDVGLDMANRAIAVVKEALERNRRQVRPRNLAFAADFAVKVAMAAARTGARDWPEELASGVLDQEVADLILRYLLKDPRGKAAR
jgi:AcrR family transcriptional regulator